MIARRLRTDAAGAVEAAVDALRAGLVVGLPTETVYGLGVLPQAAPLAALVALKGRAEDKGIALLVDRLDQVADLVELPPVAVVLAERFWPGALTLVLPLRDEAQVPELVTGGRRTLGVRLPDHPVPRALAARLGPLAVSSANRSGEPAATDADRLLAAVPGVALVLDDGPVRGGRPSSVVAVTSGSEPVVLREGAITAEALRAAAGAPIDAGTLASKHRPPGGSP